MRDAAGRSRGFAFLTFSDPESVNAVVAKQHEVDGKVVSDATWLDLGFKRAEKQARHIIRHA